VDGQLRAIVLSRIDFARLRLEAARFDNHFILRAGRHAKRQLALMIGHGFPAKFLSARLRRVRAPYKAKPRSLKTVAKITNSWACELPETCIALAGSSAQAAQSKPIKAIVRRTVIRWRKGEQGCWEKGTSGSNLFFFVFLFVIVPKFVPVLGLFLFFQIVVVGDGIDLDGMNLHDFHFRFALGAGQDFAFLDFVFIHVNFCGAFRTPDHGDNLLGDRLRVFRRRREKPAEIRPRVLPGYYITRSGPGGKRPIPYMTPRREYPEHPLVGVGGVIIDGGRVLLIRRGGAPAQGEWSIPGGLLELGETLEQGVARELAEETGLEVRVVELIEALERIFPAPPGADGAPGDPKRPQYHFVILDYLCEFCGGTLRAGSDAQEFAWAREDELAKFNVTVAVNRVVKKAFAMARKPS
jgi:8-oxo-dGTP diphosphatase